MYTLIGEFKGGISGGTIASGMTMAAKEAASEMSDLSSNAYYLASCVQGVAKGGTAKPAPMAAAYIMPAETWAGPFVMETCNGRIVQLSNALSKEQYGSDFKCVNSNNGGFGVWRAYMQSLVIVASGLYADRMLMMKLASHKSS